MPFKPLILFLALMPTIQLSGQAPEDTVITISLKAIAGLQYDLVRFSVKPGANVKVILTNSDDMEHNLVFTKPGTRLEIVDAAQALGPDGPASNYIPASSNILWFIPVLPPGQSDSLLFKAPRKTGVYPYVCTFPGHGIIMYGAMHVTNGVMPQIVEDPNVPPGRRKDDLTGNSDQGKPRSSGHPYELVPPFLYRVLLPDAGPAAIAVSLPNKLSYCWDAGACRLRYAWSGDFLDLTDYWAIKGELFGKILGTVFYRDKTEYPLRIREPANIPAVDFKGYSLVEQYPEFHYSIDGMEVFELIHPKEDGSGLLRTFRIPGAGQTIWFVTDPHDGAIYESTAGQWEDGRLRISPDEAKAFTITMTRTEGTGL